MYNVPVPQGLDLVGAYGAFRNAQNESKQNMLSQLTGAAAQGDQSALKRLFSLDPKTAMQTQQYTDERKATEMKKWLPRVYAADTPEKWSALQQQAAAEGHPLGGFDTREATYSEGLDIGAQIGIHHWDIDHNFAVQKEASDNKYRNATLGISQEELQMKKDAAANKAPDLADIYDENGQPYKAQWNPQTHKFEKVGGSKASTEGITITNADGSVTQIGGSGKAATQFQSQSESLYLRAKPTLDILNQPAMTKALIGAEDNVKGRVPIVGNALVSPQYQQAKQAADNFLTAILRKESGAAISAGEYSQYGSTFLPVYGDKPDTLAQKAEARKNALEGMKRGMSPQAILADAQNSLHTAPTEGAAPKGDVQSPPQTTKNGTTFRILE